MKIEKLKFVCFLIAISCFMGCGEEETDPLNKPSVGQEFPENVNVNSLIRKIMITKGVNPEENNLSPTVILKMIYDETGLCEVVDYRYSNPYRYLLTFSGDKLSHYTYSFQNTISGPFVDDDLYMNQLENGEVEYFANNDIEINTFVFNSVDKLVETNTFNKEKAEIIEQKLYTYSDEDIVKLKSLIEYECDYIFLEYNFEYYQAANMFFDRKMEFALSSYCLNHNVFIEPYYFLCSKKLPQSCRFYNEEQEAVVKNYQYEFDEKDRLIKIIIEDPDLAIDDMIYKEIVELEYVDS